MRRLAVVMLLASLWALPAAAATSESPVPSSPVLPSFTQGVKLYEDGRYKEAVAQFEKAIDDGLVSAPLYYNLANSYFKTGERAKAVWAYERARRLDPRDADIAANLNLLRGQLTDKQSLATGSGLADTIGGAVARFTSDEIAIAFSSAAGLLSLFLLLAGFVPGLRPFMKRVIPILILICAVLGGAAWARWVDVRSPLGVVNESEIYVRYGKSDKATKAFLLHEGTAVRILKKEDGWDFIQYGSGQRGWVPQEAILKI